MEYKWRINIEDLKKQWDAYKDIDMLLSQYEERFLLYVFRVFQMRVADERAAARDKELRKESE